MNGRIQMWAFCWIPLAVVVIGAFFVRPLAGRALLLTIAGAISAIWYSSGEKPWGS